jgi:phospholipid/cholesterol/gamma-HCH transport system ATP-binding protein
MQRIILENISKRFGDKQVLRGVNLEVNDGEILCVIGKSGSGKSVILRHLIGLLEPDEGAIYVDGIRSDRVDRSQRMKLRAKFGVLFQGAALFDSMTIFDNIAFGPRRLGRSEDEIQNELTPLIRKLGLSMITDRMPHEISGGTQKRAGLARALAMKPEIMLYDEPTTGVDPITASSVDRMIIDSNSSFGVTSLVITHDMNAVRRVAHRVAMLNDGKIIFSGTPDELDQTTDPLLRQFIEGRSDGPIQIA